MNIAVLGAGVMGRLTERVAAESGIGVAGVVEPLEGGRLENLGQKTHVVIDFSHPDNTDALCGFCAERGVKAVIGCTGHSAEQKERIRKLAESCGVVMSANFSYGLNVLLSLAGQAAALLGDDFDTRAVRNAPQTQDGRAERHRARALGDFEGSRRRRQRGGFRQERTRTETGKRDRSERAARRRRLRQTRGHVSGRGRDADALPHGS